MVGDIQKICCIKCGKYLFTEIDTETKIIRENDKMNYRFNEIKDEFICNECYMNYHNL